MAGFVSKKHSKRKSKTKKRTINPGNAEGTGQAPTNQNTRRSKSPLKRFVVAARAENSKTRKSKSSSKKAAEAGNRVRNRTNSLPNLNMTRKQLKLRRNSLPINFKPAPFLLKSLKQNVAKSAPLLTKCSFHPNTDSTKKGLIGTFAIELDEVMMKGGTHSGKADNTGYDLFINVDDNIVKTPPIETWNDIIHQIKNNTNKYKDFKYTFTKKMTKATICKHLSKEPDFDAQDLFYKVVALETGIFINVMHGDKQYAHSSLWKHKGSTFNPNSHDTKDIGVSHSKDDLDSEKDKKLKIYDVAAIEWWLSASTDCTLTETHKPEILYKLNYRVINTNPIKHNENVYKCLHKLSVNTAQSLIETFDINNLRRDSTLKSTLAKILLTMCFNYRHDMQYKTRKGLRSNLANRDSGIPDIGNYDIKYKYIREEEPNPKSKSKLALKEGPKSTHIKIYEDIEPNIQLTDELSTAEKEKYKAEETQALIAAVQEKERNAKSEPKGFSVYKKPKQVVHVEVVNDVKAGPDKIPTGSGTENNDALNISDIHINVLDTNTKSNGTINGIGTETETITTLINTENGSGKKKKKKKKKTKDT